MRFSVIQKNYSSPLYPSKKKGSAKKVLPPTLKRKENSLITSKKYFESLFAAEVDRKTSVRTPSLIPPAPKRESSYRPARFFYRGAIENNRVKNPEPIRSLLTLTNEFAEAKPVPMKSQLLRSLCRGKGSLQISEDGVVHLSIDEKFISMLLPYLESKNLDRPPYYNTFSLVKGAHIPVITSRELFFHYLTSEEMKGIGKEFSFQIEGLYSVKPTFWNEAEEVWFFKVRSKELEDFRRSLFLTDTPNGHSFHIVVAVKNRVGRSYHPLPQMQINPACLQA